MCVDGGGGDVCVDGGGGGGGGGGRRRYLEKAVLNCDYQELRLVLTALRERYLVIQSAPHLCVPLGLLTPFYSWTGVPYVYAGLKMYDLLAGWAVSVMVGIGNSKERRAARMCGFLLVCLFGCL